MEKCKLSCQYFPPDYCNYKGPRKKYGIVLTLYYEGTSFFPPLDLFQLSAGPGIQAIVQRASQFNIIMARISGMGGLFASSARVS